MQPNEIAEVLSLPISQELLARDLTRLAYVARDGTPRNVPIGFAWNGSQIVMCTSKNAPKLHALSENPMVALTIDTEVHPPKILLIRGRAELDFVDGIPDEYLQATSTYEMTSEQRVEWEAEVRSLYHDGMVRIVVTPTWAKLIDFETTLPSAVEELIRQREERQRASAPHGRSTATPKSSSTGPPSIDRYGCEEDLARPQPVDLRRARPVQPKDDQTDEKGKATMTKQLDHQALADFTGRWFALWTEPDPQARSRQVADLWAPSGAQVLVDPPQEMRDAATALAFPVPRLEVRGHDEIYRRVTRAYAIFVEPGVHTFKAAGDAVLLAPGLVGLGWEMVAVADGTVAGSGYEVIVLDDDGRILLDHQHIALT